jgi:hypothetical protein
MAYYWYYWLQNFNGDCDHQTEQHQNYNAGSNADERGNDLQCSHWQTIPKSVLPHQTFSEEFFKGGYQKDTGGTVPNKKTLRIQF